MCELTKEELQRLKDCTKDNEAIRKLAQDSNSILTKFIEQYESDMRGDKNLGNGNRGVIGEIREIKQYQAEYPSLLWLFAHKPTKTIGAILLILIVFMTLYNLGLIQILSAYFGVPMP
jgi:hypothetical protein